MSKNKVFISYSHDGPEHLARVLALSDRLRELGIDADLDRYHTRPAYGWSRWYEEQLRPENSKFVLVICSELYRTHVEHNVEAYESRGVSWGSYIISQYLHDDGKIGKRRFIPILLGDEPHTSVPIPLRAVTYYRIEAIDLNDPSFQMLCGELTSRPYTVKRRLGEKLVLDQKASSKLHPFEAIGSKPPSIGNSMVKGPYSTETLNTNSNSPSGAATSNGTVEANSQINSTVTGGLVGVSGAKFVRIENLYVGGPTAPAGKDSNKNAASISAEQVRPDRPFLRADYIQSPAYFFNQGEVIANFGNPKEQEFQFDGPRAIYMRLSPKFESQQPKVGGAKLKTVFHDNQTVKPMSLAIGGSVSRNKAGWVCLFPSSNNSTNSITQGFLNGELWGLNSDVFKYILITRSSQLDNEAAVAINAIQVERICSSTLTNYVEVASKYFELVFPFVVEIGAVGLEDCYLAAPALDPSVTALHYHGPIRKHNLIQCYDIDDGRPRRLTEIIHDFSDELYDLADCARGSLITSERAKFFSLQE